MAAYSRDYECSKRIISRSAIQNQRSSHKQSELKNNQFQLSLELFLLKIPSKLNLQFERLYCHLVRAQNNAIQTELKTIIGYIYEYI